MKKLAIVSFVAISLSTLSSCSLGKITLVKMIGDLTKKHYGYTDSWDLSGVQVVGVTGSGKETVLSAEDYSLSIDPKTPAEYVSKLTLNAKYKKDRTLIGTITIKDISVDVEPYDFNQEVANYYSGFDFNLKGETLRSKLNQHSFSKHSYFVRYSEVSNFKNKSGNRDSTDLIPNQSKMQLFYSGKVTDYGSGSKEHIWACANSSGMWVHDGSGSHNVDSSSYYGGGSDLYHVRPVSEILNSARGNSKFVDFDDSEHRNKSKKSLSDDGPYSMYFNGLNGNNQFAAYSEVNDAFKGDVARIIAYVYMHYKTAADTPSSQSSLCGNLQLKNILGYTESKCKQKLIEWNNLDPVSEVERYRNHTIQKIQGNRNPFVDYSDLMQKVFGN